MRVLHLVQQSQRRGAEMFAFDLANQQRQRGHDVRTVYLYEAAGESLPERDGDLKLDADYRRRTERFPGVQPGLVRQLADIARDHRPDIVQANGARTLKYGAALKSRSKQEFGFVYRSIGDPRVWVRGNARRLTFRHVVLPRVDGIAAVSNNTMDALREIYKLDDTVLATIPRGIDRARLTADETREGLRQRLGAAEDARVVLFVGSLTVEKRPDRLIRVFGDLFRTVPDAYLWIVGEGPESGLLVDQIAHAGLADRVRLVGSQERVGSFMNAADLLLLTSDTEGLPGVILEAAAVGLPVVSTNVGGVADAVTSGVDGLLAAPADEALLAQHCAAILTDCELARSIREVARDRFDARFSIEVVARQYDSLYDDVLVSRSR